jgi:hypothetical protein
MAEHGGRESVSVPGWIGSNQPPAFELKPEQMQKAFVTVGTQKITLASIPADQRSQAIASLQKRSLPVTEQAIANLWVQAGKPGATKIQPAAEVNPPAEVTY